jgi:hypothetical protein
MVEPYQDRNSRHLVPCMLSGTRRSTRFRNLLLNTLMGSCPVEVGHIPIEHALELLLAKDKQVEKRMLIAHSSRSVRRSHWLGERETGF